jgi:hypothetical protein
MDLIALLDSAYHRPSWHGPNLRGSIRGLSLDAISWRPAPGAHNIWELVVHAAYWKYVVRRRLLGQKRGSFPLEGSNFFARPGPGGSTMRDWKADVALLDRMHDDLRVSVAALTPAQLRRRLASGRPASWMVAGAAAHDLYHAGQIQLLKRLQRQ